MAKEIERKFLITGAFKTYAAKQTFIRQGYISTDPARTVRVRTKGGDAFITIKGLSNSTGVSRFEWEKRIPIEEAEDLFQFCLPGVIEKIRFEIPYKNHIFEVDEFFGKNLGLLIAEIELSSEDESFEKPSWLGEEVTGIDKYYNSYLTSHPYTTW